MDLQICKSSFARAFGERRRWLACEEKQRTESPYLTVLASKARKDVLLSWVI